MVDRERLAAAVRELIAAMGEDTEREGLRETPDRVARMYEELTAGCADDAAAHLSRTFSEAGSALVVERDIAFSSMCEHHLLPFYGKAHVAYIPNGYITGLSKIARVVECYARRLQVQERLTVQIRDCIQNTLHPLGVGVVIEASHMCMQIRGVQKQNSITTTSAFTGGFLKDERTRSEFMRLIGVSLH